MFKNWEAICQVKNPWLRMLVATADDSKVVQCLVRGFPELFSEEETSAKIPYSAFVEVSKSVVEPSGATAYMDHVLEKFPPIPCIKFGAQGDDSLEGAVPSEWWEIIGSVCTKEGYDCHIRPEPTFVTWYGEQCILIEACEFDPATGKSEWVTIAPARFFDFAT